MRGVRRRVTRWTGGQKRECLGGWLKPPRRTQAGGQGGDLGGQLEFERVEAAEQTTSGVQWAHRLAWHAAGRNGINGFYLRRAAVQVQGVRRLDFTQPRVTRCGNPVEMDCFGDWGGIDEREVIGVRKLRRPYRRERRREEEEEAPLRIYRIGGVHHQASGSWSEDD